MERATLHVEAPDRKRRTRLASSHDDHPASRGQSADRTIEVRLARRFPPDVHAGGSDFLQLGLDGLRFIVDDLVRAELAAELDFFVAAGGGDDAGADGPGHLNNSRADAATGAIDKNGFVFLQFRLASQAETGRDADQRDGRGLFVADTLGRPVQP